MTQGAVFKGAFGEAPALIKENFCKVATAPPDSTNPKFWVGVVARSTNQQQVVIALHDSQVVANALVYAVDANGVAIAVYIATANASEVEV